VISNPPYVARSDRRRLAPEVRDHEPEVALYAGDGGFAVIARLVPEAAALLPEGGWLALEIGEDLGARTRRLLEGSGGWRDVSIEKDLAGKTRYASAVRRGRGGT
jgi:release factor glutamine methyltransferase